MGTFRTALVLAGAVCVVSCGRRGGSEPPDAETLITGQSTDLTVRNSAGGKLSYLFETPLMEEYSLAAEPYTEFRRGVRVISYDSLQVQALELTADYAKLLTLKDLWEARGNVVIVRADGKVVRTEQLFYDVKADRIYSNVTSTMTDGEEITVAQTFETDSKFEEYRFHDITGRTLVDTESLQQPDTTAAPAPVDTLSN